MDISAILYSAIGGGGGAALGSALAFLILKTQGKTGEAKTSSGVRGGVAAACAAAGVVALSAMYKNMTLPRIIPMDDSEMIAATPIYGVIKEQSPEDYKKILFPADRAVRNGQVKQADLDEMRVTYMKLIGDKMRVASGDSLRQLERNSQSQFEIYRAKNPRICTLLLHGESFPAVEEYFSPAEIKQEQNVMVNLFTADPRMPDFVADLDKGKDLFQGAFLPLMKVMGIEDLRPDPSESAGNEAAHKEICDLAIAFSKDKQALYDDDLMHMTAYLQSL